MEEVREMIHDKDIPMHLWEKQQEPQSMSKIDISQFPWKQNPKRNVHW